jgi:hypothetical protein
MRVLLCGIAVMAISSAAWAQTAAPAPPENPENRIVCESSDPPSGSHIMTKVCHTVAEWQQIHRNTQEFLDRAQSGASNANIPGH